MNEITALIRLILMWGGGRNGQHWIAEKKNEKAGAYTSGTGKGAWHGAADIQSKAEQRPAVRCRGSRKACKAARNRKIGDRYLFLQVKKNKLPYHHTEACPSNLFTRYVLQRPVTKCSYALTSSLCTSTRKSAYSSGGSRFYGTLSHLGCCDSAIECSLPRIDSQMTPGTGNFKNFFKIMAWPPCFWYCRKAKTIISYRVNNCNMQYLQIYSVWICKLEHDLNQPS